MSVGEGVIILNESQVPPGLIIPARSVMRGIPVEPVREQTRNDVLKQKEKAENYCQLFIKIKEYLNIDSTTKNKNKIAKKGRKK